MSRWSIAGFVRRIFFFDVYNGKIDVYIIRNLWASVSFMILLLSCLNLFFLKVLLWLFG